MHVSPSSLFPLTHLLAGQVAGTTAAAAFTAPLAPRVRQGPAGAGGGMWQAVVVAASIVAADTAGTLRALQQQPGAKRWGGGVHSCKWTGVLLM
jgi:hypothetical protein